MKLTLLVITLGFFLGCSEAKPNLYAWSLPQVLSSKADQNTYERHSNWSQGDLSGNFKSITMSNNPPGTQQTIKGIELPTSEAGYRYNLFESENGGLVLSFFVQDKNINNGEIVFYSAETIGGEITDYMRGTDWQKMDR